MLELGKSDKHKNQKTTLQKQGGCDTIVSEGTPTNGASPFESGNYSVDFGESVGRGNFLFFMEIIITCCSSK